MGMTQAKQLVCGLKDCIHCVRQALSNLGLLMARKDGETRPTAVKTGSPPVLIGGKSDPKPIPA
jgi:hypothetical protein